MQISGHFPMQSPIPAGMDPKLGLHIRGVVAHMPNRAVLELKVAVAIKFSLQNSDLLSGFLTLQGYMFRPV